ncbi:MAG: hypothetical protein Q8M23_01615, partial [Bacteroidales bacterium]|nr:hypothetical protein [Bacteroidales bacterium]
MKTKIQHLALALAFLFPILFISACRDKVYEEVTYTANVPIYMSFNDFRNAVKRSQPKDLVNPGKIYFKNNYLFVNELNKGIHVIDNANPSSPQKITFIEIPGNADMAIRGNILYADSYIDLVAIDITNPMASIEIDRVPNAFPNVLPGFDISYPVANFDLSKGVVVGWEVKQHTELIERGSYYGKNLVSFDGMGIARLGSLELSFSNSSTSVGVSGSMARFTIYSTFLYALHNNSLKLFNIGSTPGIVKGNSVSLNRVVETIFPLTDKLFLGTTTGMLVYSVANPATPTFVSAFNHINSCDPVVVEGNYAYVTLRSGTVCNGFTNQLDVINISNINTPFLMKSYPFFNPHGLGIDNGILFICDGDAGLKIFNASDPLTIHMNQIAYFQNIKAYDV